ncbi:MAG TPA: hypothetical protein PKD86_14985 [Gemmatales bacterium]|nr:hypothetical protein [Gemmatales bacterium]HMP60647.1 hypothetical protein [Gemmatales bacterium]
MATTIESVEITKDGGGPIDPTWDVIGLTVEKLNVRVKITRDFEDRPPETLKVEVRAREPNAVGKFQGWSRFNSTRSATTPTATLRRENGHYSGSIPLVNSIFNLNMDQVPELATVARPMGLADGVFRDLLRPQFGFRGAGVQPPLVGQRTGEKAKRKPDAKQLFLSGGVEVVEVLVADQEGIARPRRPENAQAWAFVRSPADIFFYTGHGSWWNGNLILGGHHPDWLSPVELLKHWSKPVRTLDLVNSPWDLDVLIINGCSVLFWNRFGEKVEDKDRKSYGLDWARLLCTQEGPLQALLGFRYTSPGDATFGVTVARDMAQAIRDELGNDYSRYARKWMEICAKNKQTWTGAAIDTQGYYYINSNNTYHTHGTDVKMISYDPDLPQGTIVGPVPMHGTPPSLGGTI